MADQRKSAAPKEFEEVPDVGGPGQPHVEQTFGKVAEAQSKSDLRDRRGGATDPVNPPPERPKADVPQARTPHADADPVARRQVRWSHSPRGWNGSGRAR